MKLNIWKIMLFLGIVPFVAPFAVAVWNIFILHESWTMFEFVFLYSFLYWPTYLLGIAAIIISLCKMKKITVWSILYTLGLMPFITPFVIALWKIYVLRESYELLDYVLLHSYVYWPTYLLGLLVILFSVYKIKKTKAN